jgi:uncharacterized iron-regulated membrane protein
MHALPVEQSPHTWVGRRRKTWLRVHRYLGLSVGALLLFLSLTGSLLVFHDEIDEWFNPQLLQIEPKPGGESDYQPVDELILAAVRVMPKEAQLTFGDYPRTDTVTYTWHFLVPAVPDAKTRIDFALYHVFVNPYTAEVTGSRLVRPAGLGGAFPRTFIEFVFALHYALLLPRTGDPPFGDTVVAIIGLALTLSLLSGLYLWWPRNEGWRSAFTIKRHAHIRRLNFDVHKTAGVYFTLILLGIFVSGVFLNLRAPFQTVVRFFSPVTDRYEVQSQVIPDSPKISLGDAIRIVKAHYPEGRMDWLYIPRNPSGTYTICNRDVEGVSLFLTRRCVVVDQYSGEILYIQSPDQGTAGEYFIQWQWPFHSGQAFGLPGRWIVFTSGLACPILFGTGFYLWWRKGAARRRAK